jgi:uncharacterized membrane protein YbhN (UPF0104 family)
VEPPVAEGLSARVRHWVGGALVLATFAFLARLVVKDVEALRTVSWSVAPGWLIAAVGGQALTTVAWMAIWGVVVRGTDARPVDWRQLWRVWSLASLARYVPGGLWQFVATDALATRVGLERRTWVQTLAVHSGFVLVSAALVGFAFGPLGNPWLALPCVALVHPGLVRAPLSWRLGVAQSFWLLALSASTWLASGLAWWGLLRGLEVDVPWAWAVGVHGLGFAAGFVVLFAPAGLGVRELALTAALSPAMGPGRAAILAAASRAWTLAAELVSAAFARR